MLRKNAYDPKRRQGAADYDGKRAFSAIEVAVKGASPYGGFGGVVVRTRFIGTPGGQKSVIFAFFTICFINTYLHDSNNSTVLLRIST